MSWLSEAHSEWHAVNGHDAICPLDCGVGEAYPPEYDYTDEELALMDAEDEQARWEQDEMYAALYFDPEA